jgi:cobalt-zinc-cadmium resistance protein CzcA
MVLRLAAESRSDISNLKTLFITLPSGSQIPLEQVADIDYEPGPMQISREDGKRRIVVGFNVRGRDVKSVVDEIQKKLDKKLKLPAGYYVTYGGQFENLVEASARLSIAVPVALLLIFVLLYFTFRSMKQSLLIFTAIPFSAIGGVFALWLRDMPFSISAGVGFIALFGVAVLNGIVLIGYFNQLKAEGMDDVVHRIHEGTKVRLRPVILTAAVASLGFLPMALSTSAGAEVQKPLATVVIGGLISATLLTLIVLPILYFYFEKGVSRKIKQGVPKAVTMLVGFSLFAGFAQSQGVPTLTLQSAIEAGLKNNQQIQAGELEVISQNQLKPTAFELPKTELTGMLGQYNTRAFDQNYGISQGFNPFEFGARKEVVDANIKSSELSLDLTKQQMTLNIRQSWNSLLYLMERNQVLKQQDSILLQFVRAAKIRFDAGDVSSLESTTSIVKQQELQQQIKQTEALISMEKSRLKAYMNLQTDFAIAESEFVALPALSVTDSTALRENPQMELAMQEVQKAIASKRLQKSTMLPDLKVGYFIQSLTGDQDVNGQPVYYNGVPRFQGVTFGVSVPIFAGSSSAKVRSAETAVQVQQKNTEYLHTQLKSQFEQQIEQLLTYQSLVEYYESSALPSAKSITDNVRKSYQNGDISYVEFIQGIQTALDVQSNYLSAVLNYNQAVINLQYLLNQ